MYFLLIWNMLAVLASATSCADNDKKACKKQSKLCFWDTSEDKSGVCNSMDCPRERNRLACPAFVDKRSCRKDKRLKCGWCKDGAGRCTAQGRSHNWDFACEGLVDRYEDCAPPTGAPVPPSAAPSAAPTSPTTREPAPQTCPAEEDRLRCPLVTRKSKCKNKCAWCSRSKRCTAFGPQRKAKQAACVGPVDIHDGCAATPNPSTSAPTSAPSAPTPPTESPTSNPTTVASTSAKTVVLFMCDDMGFGDAGFNNPDLVPKTPHLDSLALHRTSIVFDQFHSSSPVCTPSRASMITGRHPSRDSVMMANAGSDQPFNVERESWSLPRELKENGVKTVFLGKWHLGQLKYRTFTPLQTSLEELPSKYATPGQSFLDSPVAHGFDTMYATEKAIMTAKQTCTCTPFQSSEQLRSCRDDLTFSTGSSKYTGRNGLPLCFPTNTYFAGEGFSHADETSELSVHGTGTEVMAAQFESVVAETEEGEDLFVNFWAHDPHEPLASLDYEMEDCKNGVTCNEALVREQASRGKGMGFLYWTSIVRIDKAVGRVIDILEEAGRWDNTLFVFLSDNGPEGSGGGVPGGSGSKRYLTEGGIRVPGLMHLPSSGKATGARRTNFGAVSTDLPWTVLDFFDIVPEAPGTSDGMSLLPVALNPETATPRDGAIHFWQASYEEEAIWSHAALDYPWKWVGTKAGDVKKRKGRLFNLVDDPLEQRDVYNANSEIYDRLYSEHVAWMGSVLCERAKLGRRAGLTSKHGGYLADDPSSC